MINLKQNKWLLRFSPLCFFLFMSESSWALEAAGKTILARGDVSAIDDKQAKRKIKRRSKIYKVDTIKTGADSRAQLRMVDGGMLALQENTELEIAKYEYDKEKDEGSAVMKLLSGGIRTVTGKLKSENGDYKLETPVGSIGIRGTHYEIELVNGELFVAVWDGAIDVTVNIGGEAVDVSVGDNTDFNYIKIAPSGEVSHFTEIPDNFKEGHSSNAKPKQDKEQNTAVIADKKDDKPLDLESKNNDQTSEQKKTSTGQQNNSDSQVRSQTTNPDTDTTLVQQNQSTQETTPQSSSNTVTRRVDVNTQEPDAQVHGFDQFLVQVKNQDSSEESTDSTEPVEPQGGGVTPETDSTIDDNENNDELVNVIEPELEPEDELFDWKLSALAAPEFIAARTGNVVFEQLIEFDGIGNSGSLTNAKIDINVDFDTGNVPEGFMSFSDDKGEWFSAFNGKINQNQLDLQVNFASHGDELANGSIDAGFVNDGEAILGAFSLQDEVNNKVTGQFLLGE